MKNLILISFFSLSFFAVKAQSKVANSQDTTIYNRVDVQPMYNGGFAELTKFVKANIKPGNDKGMVFAVFVVEKDGSLSNIKILRSPSAAASKETIRLISSFPKWKPAIKDGNIVRCTFTMPFRFPDGV